MQLAVNCILKCCHELGTQSISPDEFCKAVHLIVTTLLPHKHRPTSLQSVLFGEEERERLTQLPSRERRSQLVATVGIGDDVHVSVFFLTHFVPLY